LIWASPLTLRRPNSLRLTNLSQSMKMLLKLLQSSPRNAS
jgi:hypothetical protein